jgi:hypothetical protein
MQTGAHAQACPCRGKPVGHLEQAVLWRPMMKEISLHNDRSFQEIVRKNFVYSDKSEYIYKILKVDKFKR